MDAAREIARLLAPADDGLVLRKGVVTAVSAATVTVTIGDDPTALPGLPFFGSTPAIGAVVWVLQQGALRLVLGPLGPATHVHTRTEVGDTRSVNWSPAQYAADGGKQVRWEFKEAAAIGLTGNLGTFVGLQTFLPWSDGSGGDAYQIAHDRGRVSRRWASIGATSWGAWTLLHS